MDDLRNIVARALCTFGATIDRDQDGYGTVVPGDPHQPCAEPCDYCRHCASHILQAIEDSKRDK